MPHTPASSQHPASLRIYIGASETCEQVELLTHTALTIPLTDMSQIQTQTMQPVVTISKCVFLDRYKHPPILIICVIFRPQELQLQGKR